MLAPLGRPRSYRCWCEYRVAGGDAGAAVGAASEAPGTAEEAAADSGEAAAGLAGCFAGEEPEAKRAKLAPTAEAGPLAAAPGSSERRRLKLATRQPAVGDAGG